jgi:hypothetical protein
LIRLCSFYNDDIFFFPQPREVFQKISTPSPSFEKRVATTTMASRTAVVSFLAIFSFVPPSMQQDTCGTVRDYHNYNATGVYPMPALSLGPPDDTSNARSLEADNSKSWYLSARYMKPYNTPGDDGTNYFWVNTGDSNNTDIGSCVDATWTYSGYPLNGAGTGFQFPKEVVERSVNDTGDCKTMFGEECVQALEEHYKNQAAKASSLGTCQIQPNDTVPWQCADIVGGDESWNTGIYHLGTFGHPIPPGL